MLYVLRSFLHNARVRAVLPEPTGLYEVIAMALQEREFSDVTHPPIPTVKPLS